MRLAGRPIVGMRDLGALEANELRHATAGYLRELLVTVKEMPLAVYYGDSHGCLAEDGLEPLVVGAPLKVPRWAFLRGDLRFHVAAHLPKTKKGAEDLRIPFAPSTGRPTARPAKDSCHLLTRDYTARYRRTARPWRTCQSERLRRSIQGGITHRWQEPNSYFRLTNFGSAATANPGIGADPKLGCLWYRRPIVGGGNNAEDERRHAERDPPPVPDNGRLGLKARQHRSARRGRGGRECNG